MQATDPSAAEFGLSTEEDAALSTRAAWLYHAGGLTQSEVAERLGVTSAKAHRLIGRATRAGLVRVFVDGPIGNCIASETALAERHGLTLCRVVPVLEDEALPLRALGIAAATVLRDRLERAAHRVIGIGHGRTLASMIGFLPRLAVADLHLVSLLGGLPRRIPANPFEVIDRLAEKTGAEALLLPVPMFASAAADRDVLRRQTGVPEALALAARAGLRIVGIGEVSPDAFLSMAGVITPEEVRAARAAGAEGEMLGYFFNRRGALVDTRLHELATALPVEHPDHAGCEAANPVREVVAVAGGPGKAAAIHAVLQSGLLTGLITDESTARRLVAATP